MPIGCVHEPNLNLPNRHIALFVVEEDIIKTCESLTLLINRGVIDVQAGAVRYVMTIALNLKQGEEQMESPLEQSSLSPVYYTFI